jgi:hypothetical protein
VVEAQEVKIPLCRPLLKLSYLQRLDQKATTTLLLVGILGLPDVHYDLHLPSIHPYDGTGAFLRI